MITVQSILKTKGHTIHSVSPSASVFDALRKMAEHNCGALVVMEGAKLVGMISERDYARKVILMGRNSRNVSVGELMITKVFVAAPDITLEDCLQIMTTKKIRHLPVMDGELLAGMITIGDVAKHLLADRQFTIQQLERYIVGPTYPGT